MLNYFSGSILFYSLITIYDVITLMSNGATISYTLIFCAPFILFILLILTPKRKTFDIFIEIFLMIAVTLSAETNGDFSGATFLLILLFRLQKKQHQYVLLFLALASVSFNAIICNREIPETLNILLLFGFVIFKFTHVVIIPHNKLKNENILLKEKEQVHKKEMDSIKSIIRTSINKPLSDDEILETYPFMLHSGVNPYRKIQDLRLFADQNGYKQIAGINGISENTQSREFNYIKRKFSKKLDRKIDTVQGLIIGGIQLGIIRVDTIPN